MRLSIFSFFAFLSLQSMFFEPGYAKEPEDDLAAFIKKIQKTSSSLELWYSNYSAHRPFLSQGGVHNTNQNLYLTKATLQISNQTSTVHGGGIAINICCLDNMQAPIFFKNNYTQDQGGGIYANTQCIIQNNQLPICFDRNISQNFGGAIRSPYLNIENNFGGIYFLSNSTAKQNAGAIDCDNILIKNCGPILFFNNSALTEGGAILYKIKCELSADYGDIIFYDNLLTKPNQSNSIQGKNASTLLLGAKKYYSIKFFDPVLVQSTNAGPSPVTFNAEKDHQGIILFSSKYIPINETTIPSRFSYFGQPCTLANGIVRVTNGAGLACYQFNQDDGILCLGNNATLTTNKKQGSSDTANCNLNVTKLALDLPSITKLDSSIPKIWIYPNKSGSTYTEDNNPTITVSGDLIFLDKYGNDPYDSMDLSKPMKGVPLLYLWDNANKKIDISNLNLDGVNSQEHYGYQGTWDLHWMNQPVVTNPSSAFTANSSRSILYGNWIPTGYTPNPMHTTTLVANAIWESVYTLSPGMQLGSYFDAKSSSYFDGQITGMVHVQNSHKSTPGFHMRTKSYWAGGKFAGLQSHKLHLHFGQSFSHIKEKRTKNKLDSKNYGIAFRMNSSINDGFLYLSASVGYAYGDHKTKHFYPNPHYDISTGEFFTSTIGVFAHLLKPLTLSFSDKQVSSFVEARMFQSMVSSFQEKGAYPRSFKTNQHFYDFSLPIGLVIRSTEKLFACPNWSCKLAYQPTLYRSKPSILTTLLASNGSWLSSGTKVAKHALNFQLISEVELLSRLMIQCSYEGTFSMTTVCNYATLKGVLNF